MLVYQRAQNHPSHLKIRHILRLKAVGFPNHSKSFWPWLSIETYWNPWRLGDPAWLKEPPCVHKKNWIFQDPTTIFWFSGLQSDWDSGYFQTKPFRVFSGLIGKPSINGPFSMAHGYVFSCQFMSPRHGEVPPRVPWAPVALATSYGAIGAGSEHDPNYEYMSIIYFSCTKW